MGNHGRSAAAKQPMTCRLMQGLFYYDEDGFELRLIRR
jgi:hypothetical protein